MVQVSALWSSMVDLQSGFPVFLGNWDELNVAGFITEDGFNVLHEFLGPVAAEATNERAVLYTVQAVIQASISDFCPCAIVLNIVDQDEWLHHTYHVAR